MGRVQVVKAARKTGLVCGHCGDAIPVGGGYRYWKFRYGGTYTRCMKVTCSPAAWELVSNSKVSTLMQAENEVEEARVASTGDEAAGFLRSAVEMVQGVSEEMQAALDGWSAAGLDQTARYSDWEAGVSNLDDWVSSAESWADDAESVEGDPGTEDYDGALAEVVEQIEGIPSVEI